MSKEKINKFKSKFKFIQQKISNITNWIITRILIRTWPKQVVSLLIWKYNKKRPNRIARKFSIRKFDFAGLAKFLSSLNHPGAVYHLFKHWHKMNYVPNVLLGMWAGFLNQSDLVVYLIKKMGAVDGWDKLWEKLYNNKQIAFFSILSKLPISVANKFLNNSEAPNEDIALLLGVLEQLYPECRPEEQVDFTRNYIRQVGYKNIRIIESELYRINMDITRAKQVKPPKPKKTPKLSKTKEKLPPKWQMWLKELLVHYFPKTMANWIEKSNNKCEIFNLITENSLFASTNGIIVHHSLNC